MISLLPPTPPPPFSSYSTSWPPFRCTYFLLVSCIYSFNLAHPFFHPLKCVQQKKKKIPFPFVSFRLQLRSTIYFPLLFFTRYATIKKSIFKNWHLFVSAGRWWTLMNCFRLILFCFRLIRVLAIKERFDPAGSAPGQQQHFLQARGVRADFLLRLHLPADGAVEWVLLFFCTLFIWAGFCMMTWI